MESLRETKPLGTPRVFSCKRPFSNFQFRDKYYPVSSLGWILSQCRSVGFKTIVEERIESVGFSRSDDDELKNANCGFRSSEATRLSFFKESFKSFEKIKSIKKEAFVGYAIIKKINFERATRWIVFESIVAPTRYDNNFIHTRKTYSVRVGGRAFKIQGTLYCQQNGITNVCAHVALRTALSALSRKGDISYSEINSILRKVGRPHQPGSALNEAQIEAVVRAKGVWFSIAKYPKSLQSFIPYQKYLYGSIESGYPALMGFHFGQSVGHIIPILGHTFNEDTWIPDADSSYFSIGKFTRYVPSESWVSTYIAHDDNFGSNYCVPRSYLKERDQVSFVMGILPNDCKYDAIEAEAIAIDYLYSK